MMSAAAAEPLDPALRVWRVRVFTATWLSYCCFYFCRKPFFIAKASIGEAFDVDASILGALGVAYLFAYAAGQFISAWAGNRWGPRMLVLTGMAATAVCGVGFGLSNSWQMMAAFLFVNGLAQSTGWSGNVGAMAPWFRRTERGTVMGVWATNFQVGGVLANMVAAFVLAAYGWRWSFLVGTAVVMVAWVYFWFNQRDAPEDVGLALPPEPEEANVETADDEHAPWSTDTKINVAMVGVFYFFVKFIRYAIWSWVPFMLYVSYGLEKDDAGYQSTVFDAAGIAGVIALGVLSDRLFRGRRVGLSFIFVLGMFASCALLYLLGPTSLFAFTVCIGLVGFTLYGPDAIMTSAGAIDVGNKRHATLAAGIINGMGSIGAICQELVLGRILGDGQIGAVFATLLISAGCAAACLSVLLVRNRQGHADL